MISPPPAWLVVLFLAGLVAPSTLAEEDSGEQAPANVKHDGSMAVHIAEFYRHAFLEDRGG